MNSTKGWRPDIVCKLEFIDKFNIEVSYQNLKNDFSFQNVHPSLFMTTPLILFFSNLLVLLTFVYLPCIPFLPKSLPRYPY